jgi:short-chain fatty acids transporter
MTAHHREGRLARLGLALAAWSERWFPDPLVIAMLGVVVAFLLGVLSGVDPGRLVVEGGRSFWALVPFTMQMIMVIVGGHLVASTRAVRSLIRRLAGVPSNPRSAVAWIALFSMLTSLLSWGLSLIFSGLLVREMAHRIKGLDYRAAGAAAYLGLGVTWAMGLSSSAAMLMAANPSSSLECLRLA